MDREEFETYLNANSRVVAIFRSQASAYQHSKNRQRAASKRWSGKNVNGPDKNCTVLPNAYGCHLNSRIIRSFISV